MTDLPDYPTASCDSKSSYWKVYHIKVYCINTVMCVFDSANDFSIPLYTLGVFGVTFCLHTFFPHRCLPMGGCHKLSDIF